MNRLTYAIASAILVGTVASCDGDGGKERRDGPWDDLCASWSFDGAAYHCYHEVVATVTPVDVLLVVDNSSTMTRLQQALVDSLASMLDGLMQTEIDFQFGVITTDVECNLPDKDCSSVSSHACCNLAPATCQDVDTDHDGIIDSSNCDGGRLRSSTANRRVFARPDPTDRDRWLLELTEVVEGLGTGGSPYESGFEAVRRAVGCSTGLDCDPRDSAVADLNRGFIREEANLTVIIVTDEDDCSFMDRTVYHRPLNPGDALEQAAHLCWPDECYSGWGRALDRDGDGIQDWADADDEGFFRCGNPRTEARRVDPPTAPTPTQYLTSLLALKGGDPARLAMAVVTGSVPSASAPVRQTPNACVPGIASESADCGCLAGAPPGSFWCALTGANGQRDLPFPVPPGGCEALPGARYLEFLTALKERRVAAGLPSSGVHAESACQAEILAQRTATNPWDPDDACFDMGETLEDPTGIQVNWNGQTYDLVERFSANDGWSWVEGTGWICLEGSLTKSVGGELKVVIPNR